MFRRLAKVLLLLLFGLVLVTFIVATTFIYRPGWIVNTNNLRRLVWLLAPGESSIRWQRLQLNASTPQFLVHEYKLIGKQVCIDEAKVEGCIANASVNIRVNFHRWPYVVEALGPALIQGDQFIIRPSPAKSEKETPFDWEKLYSHLSRIRWEPLTIELKSFRVHATEKPTELSNIKVTVNRTSENMWSLNGRLGAARGLPVRRLRIETTVRLNQTLGELWQSIDASVQGDLPDGKKIAVKTTLKRIAPQEEFALNVHGLMKLKEGTINFDSKGTWRRGAVDVTLQGTGLRVIPQIPRITVNRCGIKGKIPLGARERIFLNLDCPITASPVVSWPSSVKMEGWPDVISILAQGKLEYPRGRGQELRADFTAKSAPVSNSFFNLQANTEASFTKLPNKDTKLEKLTLNFDGKITRFSKLVKVLENSPWAIPAPVRSFQGELGCTANGDIDLKNNDIAIPIHCMTALLSTRQELQADGKGLFRAKKRPSGWQPTLTASIQVQKAQLEVPDIDWRKSFPRLFTDKRISLEEPGETLTKPRFNYVVSVNTKRGAPIKLLSNLAHEPIPVELKGIRLSSQQPISGTVVVRSFGLRPLKQRASLEKFVIIFPGGGSPALLDGTFDIFNVDYTIKLAVVGTTTRPRIDIFSDPPRSQSELLSAVIFGGSSELSSDQMRSVEEARAAIADGAISLISMYYLAATPIDSIGYNPYTGIVRAKVKLNDRTSLTIGSDLRSQQTIGLRRRLSPNWSVETTAQHNTESEEQSERAMLRWAKRY